MTNDIWVEVDLSALKHNLAQVRGFVGDTVKIMAVVKANGFGHGYVEPSRAFLEAGADALAVTRLDEAMPLREAGIDAPILLFAPIQPENAEVAVEAGLDVTVTGMPLARAMSEAAQRLGKSAHVQIKVDTGMGRLGAMPGDAMEAMRQMQSLPAIEVTGLYTHFATAAESDLSTAREQLTLFQTLVKGLRDLDMRCGLIHAANSAAILRLPESHFDMVRPGTILYGQYPSRHVPRLLDLKPTWKLKARVCEVRDVPAGSRIGYGGEFTARRPTRTAIIPIGYADGFTLAPEGPIYRQSVPSFAIRKMRRSPIVEVRGRKAPVVGRVAMQMTVIDVTDIDGVQVGNEVTIPAMRIPTSALVRRVYG